MDIQSRKIEFVKKFLEIQSEEMISRLESIIRKDKKDLNQGVFKPMSIEEFNLRIDKSMEDSKNGRLIEANDLKAKIEKWN